MVLSIKSPEADRLARELARRRKQPITTVVVDALRLALAREKAQAGPPGIADRLMAIGKRYSELPDLDPRSDEGFLGYDDMEKPR